MEMLGEVGGSHTDQRFVPEVPPEGVSEQCSKGGPVGGVGWSPGGGGVYAVCGWN